MGNLIHLDLTKYEREVAEKVHRKLGNVERIFELVAGGATLDEVATKTGTTRYGVYSIIAKIPQGREKLEIARRAAADKYAEDVLYIADSATKGEEKLADLKISARKWLSSVYDPERFAKSLGGINVNIGELHLAAMQQIERSLRGVGDAEVEPVGAAEAPAKRGTGRVGGRRNGGTDPTGG
jgi:hypothetical protein